MALLILILTWDRIPLVLGATGVAYAALLAAVFGRESVETCPLGATNGNAADNDRRQSRDVLADRRAFIYPMLAALLFFVTRGVATKGVRTFVPAFVTDVYGYSLSLFGITVGPEPLANVYFSALLLTAAIVQLIAGGLTDRCDHRRVIVGMFGLATLGRVALSYVRLSPIVLLVALQIVGRSSWGANPARDTLVSGISPAE